MSVDFMAQRGEGFDTEFLCEPVNVSNANAAALLERLGLRPDGEPVGELLPGLPDFGELCGECDPEMFLGRVLLAQGLLGAYGDGGTPAVQTGGHGSAIVVDCGRAPGYFERRLAELAGVATTARAAGGKVAWA